MLTSSENHVSEICRSAFRSCIHQRQIRFTGGDGPSSGFDRLLNGSQRLSAFRHHRTSSAFFVLNVTVFSPGTRLAGISQTNEPPALGTIAKK